MITRVSEYRQRHRVSSECCCFSSKDKQLHYPKLKIMLTFTVTLLLEIGSKSPLHVGSQNSACISLGSVQDISAERSEKRYGVETREILRLHLSGIPSQNVPCSNVQSPQFFSSLLSPGPQSLTKSHNCVELTHLLDLHVTAHGLGVVVGVGASKGTKDESIN